MLKLTQWLLVGVILITLTACGGGGAGGGLSAVIQKIADYAQNGGTPPTVQMYTEAGVTGVTSDNLDEINAIIAGLSYEDVDTTAEIQALADRLGVDITNPIFTSSASASVAENQTSAITLVATDTTTVSYSISGGDASSFTVDSSSGVVIFRVAPDYETRDSHSYSFTAKATDEAGNESTQEVIIYITKEIETNLSIYEHNVSRYFTNDLSKPINGYSYAWANAIHLSKDEKTVYVQDKHGFKIMDLTNYLSPELIGKQSISGFAQDMVVSKDETKVFIISESNALYIYDITNKTDIELLGRYDKDWTSMRIDISPDDKTVYLTSKYKGLKIIDVSIPSKPELKGSYSLDKYIHDVKISTNGKYVYVTSTNGLEIIDVTDSSSPQLVGHLDGSYDGLLLSHDNKTAYLGGSKLSIIDISAPSTPILKSSMDIHVTRYGGLSLSENENIIYVGSYRSITSVDVSNIENPFIVSISKGTGFTSMITACNGKIGYVAQEWWGLRVVDLANRLSNQHSFSFGMPYPEELFSFVEGNKNYIYACTSSHIEIFELNTTNINWIESIEADCSALAYSKNKNLLYRLSSDSLTIYNTNEGVSEVENLPLPFKISSYIGDTIISKDGNKLIFSSGKILYAIDISNELKPKYIGKYVTESSIGRFVLFDNANKVSLSKDKEIDILNIEDINSSTTIAKYDLNMSTYSMALSLDENKLYFSTNKGIKSLNLADYNGTEDISSFYARGILLSKDQKRIIASGYYDTVIINIDDSSETPLYRQRYPAYWISEIGDNIYFSDDYGLSRTKITESVIKKQKKL